MGAAWLAAAAAPASSPRLSLAVSAAAGVVRADVVLAAGASDEPVAALRDGLESCITFTLRCYRRQRGLAALFGDALIAERTVARVAFYDAIERRFVVEQDDARSSYADEAAFREAFFTLRGVALGPAAPARESEVTAASRYVAARAQYDPVRLSPPLTILTLFGLAARYTSPWVREAVPAEEAP